MAGQVRVRYWAAIRAAAGQPTDEVSPGSLAQVLAHVTAAHADSARFAQVLSTCSVLVDEQPVGARDRTEVEVPPGATVDLLPPFAGGGGVPRRSHDAGRATGNIRIMRSVHSGCDAWRPHHQQAPFGQDLV